MIITYPIDGTPIAAVANRDLGTFGRIMCIPLSQLRKGWRIRCAILRHVYYPWLRSTDPEPPPAGPELQELPTNESVK